MAPPKHREVQEKVLARKQMAVDISSCGNYKSSVVPQKTKGRKKLPLRKIASTASTSKMETIRKRALKSLAAFDISSNRGNWLRVPSLHSARAHQISKLFENSFQVQIDQYLKSNIKYSEWCAYAGSLENRCNDLKMLGERNNIHMFHTVDSLKWLHDVLKGATVTCGQETALNFDKDDNFTQEMLNYYSTKATQVNKFIDWVSDNTIKQTSDLLALPLRIIRSHFYHDESPLHEDRKEKRTDVDIRVKCSCGRAHCSTKQLANLAEAHFNTAKQFIQATKKQAAKATNSYFQASKEQMNQENKVVMVELHEDTNLFSHEYMRCIEHAKVIVFTGSLQYLPLLVAEESGFDNLCLSALNTATNKLCDVTYCKECQKKVLWAQKVEQDEDRVREQLNTHDDDSESECATVNSEGQTPNDFLVESLRFRRRVYFLEAVSRDYVGHANYLPSTFCVIYYQPEFEMCKWLAKQEKIDASIFLRAQITRSNNNDLCKMLVNVAASAPLEQLLQTIHTCLSTFSKSEQSDFKETCMDYFGDVMTFMADGHYEDDLLPSLEHLDQTLIAKMPLCKDSVAKPYAECTSVEDKLLFDYNVEEFESALWSQCFKSDLLSNRTTVHDQPWFHIVQDYCKLEHSTKQSHRTVESRRAILDLKPL
jgi:hypothetical protein